MTFIVGILGRRAPVSLTIIGWDYVVKCHISGVV